MRRGAPWFVLAMAVALFAAYAFPGYMSFDSALQLREARSGSFSDWHPPLMAEIWRWCDAIIAGPALMLVLQAGLFVTGIYLIAAMRMTRLCASLTAAVLLVFPPIATVLAVIWKDSQMLGFFALGLALLLRQSRRAQIAGIVLFALGTAMRHNAFTITPALVVPLFRWWPDGSRRRRYALAFAVWAALTGAAELANNALTSRETYPWHGSVALFDITGMLRYTPGLTDAEAHELVGPVLPADMTDVRAHAKAAYDPVESWFRVLDHGFLAAPKTADERAAITEAWKALLRAHPRAYLHHRWAAYVEVLALSLRRGGAVYAGWDSFSPYTHRSGSVQLALQDGVDSISRSWLWWPWVYLVVVLIAGGFAVWRRDVLAIALCTSSLVSEAALFFITPTPDFRYSIWMVVCALLVPALLLGYRQPRVPHSSH